MSEGKLHKVEIKKMIWTLQKEKPYVSWSKFKLQG